MKSPHRLRRLSELAKTQVIRLADVFLIGPLMIYAGTRGKLPPLIDLALIGTGILTISYNADNYVRNRSIRQ